MAENIDELVYDRVCDALRSVHAVGGEMTPEVFNKVVDAIACLDAGTVNRWEWEFVAGRGMAGEPVYQPVFRIDGEVVTRDEWMESADENAKWAFGCDEDEWSLLGQCKLLIRG